ncbi:MAG: zeta toxin family protein [Clostridium sp.]|nr:zeta toxin family protein [Clostridium sp.]MCM1173236.1 zeta toxin family protein [Clostridium sp.]MCM1208458.1 zeta toxin family protein [Ruminococcus sp.]
MSELQKKPEIVVFAGPNGSGKSTFTALLKPSMDYINADEIKKNLKCSDYEAAELAEKQRETHLRNMDDFCFETVMSTERNLNLLRRAKEKGYFIRCYYILTTDPMINVFRVKARVETGGHDVPEDKIIMRYDKALALVQEVVSVCDICHIYDNSETKPYRIYKKRKEESFFDECDDWTKLDIILLTRDNNAKRKNLNG